MNSLDAFEHFVGEPLAEDTLERLLTGPDDHVVELGFSLSSAWDDWLTERFESADRSASDPLFLQPDFHRGVTSAVTEATCKRLALYFDKIVIADPVEVAVASRMMVWSAINAIDLDAYRQELRTGYEALQRIAPLLRTGALVLAPLAQAGFRPEVQEHARREINAVSSPSDAATSESATEFALASALSSQLKQWPVAGSEQLWRRLQSASTILKSRKPHQDMLAQSVAEFAVPSASKVPMHDLVALRSSEAAFAEFREAYAGAMLEAAQLARQQGGAVAAETLLRDRLQIHRDRCVAAAERTPALDGLILPTGALFGAGLVNYSLGVLPTGAPELTKLATELAAPGALWLVVRLIQALKGAWSGHNSAAVVYGALLERL
jgi:hypothetical protein